jgi:hypothetical protein
VAPIWIPFGAYSPGGSDFGQGLAEALNVLPLFGNYHPLRGLTGSVAVTDIPATGAYCHVYPVNPGLATYSGDGATIFMGTKTKLYESTTTAFNDLSRGAGYGAALAARPAGWRFASFGNDVWATNVVDPIQRRTNNTGAFADGVASTLKPVARFLAPVREFMIAVDPYDTFYWSDENDATWYDDRTGTRPASAAGSKPVRSRPGQITGFTGGNYGIFYKRRSIFVLQFTGGDDIWRLDELSNNTGVALPGSLVQGRAADFFFGGDGFYTREGQTPPVKISTSAIDQLMIDAGRFSGKGFAHGSINTLAQEDDLMHGFEDGRTGLVFWFYQTSASGSTTPLNHGLVYNPADGAWTRLDGTDLSFDIARGVSIPDSSVAATTDDMLSTVIFQTKGTDTVRLTFSAANLAGTVRTLRRNDTSSAKLRVKNPIPVFTVPDSDALTPTVTPTPIPNAAVTIRMANDPHFRVVTDADGGQISPRSEVYAQADASELGGVYPNVLEGYWYDAQVDMPAASSWHALEGLWLDVEPK